MASYLDDSTELQKARIAAASHEKVAATQSEGTVAAAKEHAAGQVGAAGVSRAGLAKLQEEELAQKVMDTRTKGLGDAGTSWGGQGQINLAAVRKGAGIVPAGTGPETGEVEQVGGGFELLGDGTFNRPAHREVIGAEGGGPVHIIRRMKSTYAGGASPEEYQDFGAARQAINRAAGVGEYVSPEEAKYIAEAKRKPFEAMKAEAGYIALAREALRQKMIGEFGVPDPADPSKTVLPPELEKLYAKHSSGLKHPDDVKKVWGEIAPWGETYKTINLLKDKNTRRDMVRQAQDYFANLPPEKRPLVNAETGERMTTEAFRAFTDRMPLDPESVGWMMKYGGLVSPGAAKITKPTAGAVPLPPGFTPAAAPAAAAAPGQPIMAAETPLTDYAPQGGGDSAVSAVRPAPTTRGGGGGGGGYGNENIPGSPEQYHEEYGNLEKLRGIMQKPIQDRGPEDIAYLQSLGPDYNIQANLALHKMRGFFRISPNEYDERLANMRKLYEPGAAR